jgi:short-subunit dehydrogenase
LNAGIAQEGPTAVVTDEDLQTITRVNALHPCYLGKVLMERQVQRGQRSALIVTGSIMGKMYNMGGASYSATKAFVSNFFESVHYEVVDKVDVMVWAPGGVATKIFEDTLGKEKAAELAKVDLTMVSTERAVTAMLKDLGKTRYTNGAF